MVVWARPGAVAAEPQPSEEPGANAREEQPHAEEPWAQASDDRLPVPSKSRAAARRTASSSTMVTGGDLLKSGNMLERPLRAWCIAEDPRAEIEMRVAPIVAPGQKRKAPIARSLLLSDLFGSAALSDHFIHGHTQTARTDGSANRPYEPCCRRNEDEAARIGRSGEKSAGAGQPIANTGTHSRENEMRTMMVRFGGQRCCRQR
jgi:hypothetical protein